MKYTSAQQIVRKITRLKKNGFEETSEKIIVLNIELEKLRSNYFSTKKEINKYPIKYISYNKNDNKIENITEIFRLIKSKETYYGYYTSRRYHSAYMRNSYTPCGLFYGTNSIRKLNGIILLQIKGKPLISTSNQIIRSDKYTFATYHELEEKIINILVKADGITTLNIALYQKAIHTYYQKQFKNLKITIPDFKIALPLTHDSALYYNENSDVFKI